MAVSSFTLSASNVDLPPLQPDRLGLSTFTISASDLDLPVLGGDLAGTSSFDVSTDGIDLPELPDAVRVTIHTRDQRVSAHEEIDIEATVDGPDGTTIRWTFQGGLLSDDEIEDPIWTAPGRANTTKRGMLP